MLCREGKGPWEGYFGGYFQSRQNLEKTEVGAYALRQPAPNRRLGGLIPLDNAGGNGRVLQEASSPTHTRAQTKIVFFLSSLPFFPFFPFLRIPIPPLSLSTSARFIRFHFDF